MQLGDSLVQGLDVTTHDRGRELRRHDDADHLPGLWRLRLRHWKRMNRAKKPMLSGKPVPSLNEEYLLYQTLLGMWPEEPPQNQQWQVLRKRVRERPAAL